MCHKAPNPSSPTHTHTHKYTLLRWRKRGSRGDRKDRVEDWGWGERGEEETDNGVPAGVVPPSCDSYFTICLAKNTHTHTFIQRHTHKNSPPSLLSQPLIPRVCVHMHAHTCTQKHWYTHARTYAGMTVRQMTGGSSQCNSPSWPNTDSSRHLRQLPLSKWKEPIWNRCQKKSTVAEVQKGVWLPNRSFTQYLDSFYFTREDCSTVSV